MQVPWQLCSNDASRDSGCHCCCSAWKHVCNAKDLHYTDLHCRCSWSQHAFARHRAPELSCSHFNACDCCLERQSDDLSLILHLRDARSKYLPVMLGPEATSWPSGVRGGQAAGFRRLAESGSILSSRPPDV